jgi:hypothetical protein
MSTQHKEHDIFGPAGCGVRRLLYNLFVTR